MQTRLLAIALIAAASWALALSLGGFAREVQFGPPPEPRAYATHPPSPRSFFVHDQALKLGLLAGFLVVAGALVFFGRPWLGKVFLAVWVPVWGFALGGFLCPTAGVQNVFFKANTGDILTFLLPVLGGLLFGRVFCGNVGPFGALQEVLHRRRWAPRLLYRVWRVLNWLRYVVLGYLVVRVLHTVAFANLSPFKPLFAWSGTAATMGFTAGFALFSVFLFRPLPPLPLPLWGCSVARLPVQLVWGSGEPGLRWLQLVHPGVPGRGHRRRKSGFFGVSACGACSTACRPGALALRWSFHRILSAGA